MTAFLLARGADPLRPCNGMTVVAEAEIHGHWLAAEIMRAWTGRGRTPGRTSGRTWVTSAGAITETTLLAATDAGMHALWNLSRFTGITDYETWGAAVRA